MQEEVDPNIPLTEYNKRRDASCQLASILFLYPEFVLKTSLDWLSQYSNYIHKNKEEDFFGDIVGSLLQNSPHLKLYVNEGMTHDDSYTLSYRSTIHFVGGDSHYIPMTYYDDNGVDKNDNALFSSLGFLLQPGRKSFIQRNGVGQNGELELDHYVHDSILLHFYDPFFYVLTLYKLHMASLIGLSGGRQLADWLPRHKHSLRAINESSLGKVCCFGVGGEEEVDKRTTLLKKELRGLYDVLNTSDLEKARDKIGQLWEKRATQCYEEPNIRYKSLIHPITVYKK
jgi:hypothetical protein